MNSNRIGDRSIQNILDELTDTDGDNVVGTDGVDRDVFESGQIGDIAPFSDDDTEPSLAVVTCRDPSPSPTMGNPDSLYILDLDVLHIFKNKKI